MQVGICLPHYGKTMDPAGMRVFAQVAEAAGFASIWVSDDVILPRDAQTPYKDNMLEALTTLGFLAGVTSTMGLGVSVAVLPYRHPVMTAKAIATVDVLSAGRAIFGVGVGAAQPAEFRALDVRYDDRGRRSDEYLRAILSLWTDPDADVVGEHVRIEGMHFSPAPLQRPHPPVWVGGRSKRALRRAVELGDGWHPVYLTPDEMAAAGAHLRELSDRHGRARPPMVTLRLPVFFDVRGPELVAAGDDRAVAAQAAAFARAGVEHLVFDLPDIPFEPALEQLRRVGENVLPVLREEGVAA